MKSKCIAFLVSLLVLSGCAGSSAAGSTAQGPTVSNGLKDDEAFAYLSSYSLATGYNVSDDDKITVYLPKENASIYGSLGYASGHGLSARLSINGYETNNSTMQEYIDESIADVTDEYGYLETAKVLDMHEDTQTKQYYQEAYYLCENWEQKAVGKYTLVLARQLSEDMQYVLTLEIAQEDIDDSTSDVLSEIASYYEFTPSFDSGILSAAAQNYNDNPPDYRYQTEFSIKFSLPRGYEYDYTNSDYDGTAIFAPDGDASTVNCVNIYLAELANGYSGDDDKVEEAIKKDFETAVSGESVNVAITEADIDKGDKPVVRYDGYSDGLHIAGYLFAVDGNLYSCFTASTEEITDEELIYVQTLVTSAVNAY